MKKLHIYVFIISVFCCSNWGFSQEETSTQAEEVTKDKKSLFISADLMMPLSALWTMSNGFELILNKRIYKSWHAALEGGMQESAYDKLGWQLEVDGMYAKIGANYSFYEASYSTDDFVYAGLRYGFAQYNQKIDQYVITSENAQGDRVSTTVGEGFPKEKLQAGWLEVVFGVRKALAESNFYIDTAVRPKLLLHAKKQNEINPILIPGFGKVINGASLSLQLGIGYKIPL